MMQSVTDVTDVTDVTSVTRAFCLVESKLRTSHDKPNSFSDRWRRVPKWILQMPNSSAPSLRVSHASQANRRQKRGGLSIRVGRAPQPPQPPHLRVTWPDPPPPFFPAAHEYTVTGTGPFR